MSKSSPKRNLSHKDADGIRLNKYVANAGVCSRRKADEYIADGLVKVNGEVITAMGYKVQRSDVVEYKGKKLVPEKFVYVLLNKPKDFITTSDDPQGRRTVMNLIAKASDNRLYPVGRLDRNTTGLLLLTNDGELAQKLTHPKFNVNKTYHVLLDKPCTKNDIIKIGEGLTLEDGFAPVDKVYFMEGASKKEVAIEIHLGRNRIVRRIFESLGYEVVKLDRVVYAGLTKKDVPRGKWRYLRDREVRMLKYFT